MTIQDLHEALISGFQKIPGAMDLLSEKVSVTKSSEPEKNLRPVLDPPSTVRRPEYCVTAEILGKKGEAYTETPESFQGTLKEALEIAPSDKGISAVTISALNAAMHYLGLVPGTFPDDPGKHFCYADQMCSYVKEHYGTSRIVLVGYDGYMVKRFMEEGLDFWTMDRDPDHISQDRFNHVVVNSAKLNRESSFAWANILLITGSTLCNGTIMDYLNSGKELLFYGITFCAAAKILSLPWFDTSNI